MSTINGKACVVNGKPVDKVYSDGAQVYGMNLARGTSPDWQKVAVQSHDWSDWTTSWAFRILCEPIYKIIDGETYTAQVEVRNATHPIMLETNSYHENPGDWGRTGLLSPSKFLDNDGKIIVTFTAHLPNGYSFLRPNLAFTQPYIGTESYEFRRFKIERGTIATPWTPAPEDVGVGA